MSKPAQPTATAFPEQPLVSGRRWWYRKNGSQVGPVEESTLMHSFASGMLGSEDFVWTDGMPQWLPAQQVPELNTAALKQYQPSAFDDTNERNHGLPLSLCKTAAHSRPWAIFIAIVAFVYAGLSIVGGIVLLILGANQHLPPLVAQGLFGMVFGIDASIGGCLLMNYANRLGGLRYENKESLLEKGLDTLRAFWIFISINLILILALLALFAIYAISFAGASPLSV
jgi:hypothetical protein